MHYLRLGSHYSVWRDTEPTSTREATPLLQERSLPKLKPSSLKNPSRSRKKRKGSFDWPLSAWMSLCASGTED